MFILILKIIGICIFLVCLGFLAYWGMALLKGDCSLRMLKGKMTPLKVEDMDRESVVLSFTIPIVNTGRQIGTIMDAFVRTYLPFEQYDKASVTVTLTAADTIKGKSGNILRDLENFPDMPMDIIYQVVARSDYYYAKTRITLTSEDLRTALYQYTSGVRK
mgnify:CR=1 FL=1